MENIFTISGMTCEGCQKKVQSLLEKVEGASQVKVNLENGTVRLNLDKGVGLKDLQNALASYPKYTIQHPLPVNLDSKPTETGGFLDWVKTYKPILLIFFYILFISFLIEWISPPFILERWMNHFMAGFFLVFSFFKLLDLKGFASSYSDYDIIAQKWSPWAYLYAYLEFFLGIAYVLGIYSLWVNGFTFLLMSISLIGVLNSVLNKRKIKCACLGSVFNLPMSSVTIFEDGLMIAMSAYMVIRMVFIG